MNREQFSSPHSSYQPATPPQRRRTAGLWIAVAAAVLLIIVAVSALPRLSQASAGKLPVEPYIAVVPVQGIMTGQAAASSYQLTAYNHQYLLNTIDTLIEDDNNCGLLLYIDSGGGEILAASELAAKVDLYRAQTNRPVYAYGHAYAASGAYWLASTCDYIMLNTYCITGSIGVAYGALFDFSGLLDKYGIKSTTITSGSHKDVGSQWSGRTADNQEVYQAMVDEYYGYFIDWITAHRNLERGQLLALADGRIYTASQAVGHGLADAVGDYAACLAGLQQACGGNYQTVLLQQPEQSSALLRLLGTAHQGELQSVLDLLPLSGALAYYHD